MKHKRKSYQQGSLTTEKRKSGPAVWIYRWRELGPGGISVNRKVVVGDKATLPTKAAALKAVDGLRLEINQGSPVGASARVTVDQVIEHYRLLELAPESPRKTTRTKQVYEQHLSMVISPRWGAYRLRDVKPVAVESWLAELPVAASTRCKTRNVFGALFQHAMRHEWAASNPIRLVRQSALPLQEQVVLTVDEVKALLSELRDPFRLLIWLAAGGGFRRGELFGLKWADVDFAKEVIRVERSIVDQVEGPPKTLASRRPVELTPELGEHLKRWREQTLFPADSDWVFASAQALGKLPYWPNTVLTRHVRPAAVRAGITKRIGWHSFRRTLATLSQASGASVKTTQELLRHASPVMTMGTYAKAVREDKRAAQSAVLAMFSGEPERQSSARA